MKRRITTFATALLVMLAVAPSAQAEPQLLTQFCGPGSIGECINPSGVAVSPVDGDVYVAQTTRIGQFTAWGEFVRAWGGGVVSGGAVGVGVLTPGSTQVTAVDTTSKAFLRGMPIEGAGLSPQTRIAKVEHDRLVLSRPATAAATGAPTAIESPEAPANVPVNELQRITVTATGGAFNLLFEEAEPALGTETTTSDLPYNASAGEVQAALEALPRIGAGNVEVTASNPGGSAGVPGGPYTVEFRGARWADTDVRGLRVTPASSPLTGGTARVTPVRQGASSLEVCTGIDCVAGVDGNRAGQFATARGVTVDSGGNVYAYERVSYLGGTEAEEKFNLGALSNNRVQKFTADGEFLLMFGKDVNLGGGSPGNPGDVCTAEHLANGDLCTGGSIGGGDGEFGLGPVATFGLETGDPIAAGPGDVIYVGGNERVQAFDSGGAFLESVPVPGESLSGLAVDNDPGSPSFGDLFAIYFESNRGGGSLQVKADVHRLEAPTGLEQATYPVLFPMAVAVGRGGAVYAYQPSVGAVSSELVGFSPGGQKIFGLAPDGVSGSWGLAAGDSCGREGDGIYISSLGVATGTSGLPQLVDAYGPAPDPAVCPPPVQAPSIEAQFTTTVGTTDAALRSTINPHFWNNTRYRVQYGTGNCSAGGCVVEKPAAPGALLTTAVKDSNFTTPEVILEGLEPNTIYHYRFVAEGGGGSTVGEERTFRTLPLPGGHNTNCPNQALRTGTAAQLPDCRAYEMVSPTDKNNGDVAGRRASIVQAAVDGNRFTFGSMTAFAGAESAPLNNQYLASRGANGWSTESATTPGSSAHFYPSGSTADARPYKAFSDDLCSGWLIQGTNVPLVPQAPTGVPALYRRDLCGGGYELLTTSPPPGFGFGEAAFVEYLPELQAVSADGSRSAFVANASLQTRPGDPRPPLRCVVNHKTATLAFSWLREGVPIPGAEGDEYTPTVADQGTAIQCRATATEATGTTVATGAVMAIEPVENPRGPRPPRVMGSETGPIGATVAGAPEVGQTLTCDPGAWLGSPTFTYRWLRNGTPIAGAENDEYVLAAADSSKVVQCEVAAINAAGTAVGDSQPLLIDPDPPLAISPPTISGTAEVGQTLTCDPGTWSGEPAFTYRWLRNGAPIALGATSPSRAVVAADAGKTLQCRVTAGNAAGQVSSTSDRMVVPAAPATEPPQQVSSGSLAGGDEVGQTLTCDPGAWLGSPTFTYRWLRNGLEIAGAETPTYVLQADDAGRAVQCQVSAANAGGTTTAIEGSVGGVRYSAPDPAPSPPAASAYSYSYVQVYLEHEGELALVSVLPDGTVWRGPSSVGTFQANSIGNPDEHSVYHALSADGSRVFWTASEKTTPTYEGVGERLGHLYLRVNATEPQSAVSGSECTESARACTLPVSELVSPGKARFLAADPAATRALFAVGDKLYEYETEPTPQATEVAGGYLGLLGASEDATLAYFASSQVLTGSQQNSEGNVARPGEPNVYLYKAGEGFTFVATLATVDGAARADVPTAVNDRPMVRASQATPDGDILAFTSFARLTGYDNTELVSGDPAAEIYLYKADDASLACVSCNPSGARPRGRGQTFGENKKVQYAALVPSWSSQTHPGNALSSDGRRLFFDAYDSLVPGDTNGQADVYQWEEAGKGDCTETSASYSEANRGCIALISSGQSSEDSEFFGATASGSDVFFATASSLLPQDNGLVDVYDARIGGGFPPPSPPAPGCEGEACQGTPAAPSVVTPASSTFQGAGNVAEEPRTKPRCRKGKVRRGGRCVKKRKQHIKPKSKKQTKENRRIAR